MTIFPVQKDGQPTLYHSGAVYLQEGDHRYLVGMDYEADSITEVIRQAVLNAKVKQMRLGLTARLSLRCDCVG